MTFLQFAVHVYTVFDAHSDSKTIRVSKAEELTLASPAVDIYLIVCSVPSPYEHLASTGLAHGQCLR
jgi:hypothetical protein